MKLLFLKLIQHTGYILATPYFIFLLYYFARSIADKGLGGGMWSFGFTVFVYTLPWSFFIDEYIDRPMKYYDHSSFSLEHPIIYISILGICYFVAIILNTAILFVIGKGIYRLAQIIFHI